MSRGAAQRRVLNGERALRGVCLLRVRVLAAGDDLVVSTEEMTLWPYRKMSLRLVMAGSKTPLPTVPLHALIEPDWKILSLSVGT